MQQIISNKSKLMNRMSKKLIALAGSAMAVAVAFAQVPEHVGGIFCSCPSGLAVTTELPMSHPINRCASAQIAEVSWSSWIRGQSNSYQFHFLDLLELLSRQAETSKEKSPV